MPTLPPIQKPIVFEGGSRDDLKAFPASARQDAGVELDRVQRGLDPISWRAMRIIGSGACEIRVHDETGAFRVIYVAKFEDAIHVLHCFHKTTQETAQSDVQIAAKRYRELVGSRK